MISSLDNIDLDTMSAAKNATKVGRCIKALALDQTVKEMLNSEEKSVVTYSNGGSKKHVAGLSSVQTYIYWGFQNIHISQNYQRG